jgi:hypothetical protein
LSLARHALKLTIVAMCCGLAQMPGRGSTGGSGGPAAMSHVRCTSRCGWALRSPPLPLLAIRPCPSPCAPRQSIYRFTEAKTMDQSIYNSGVIFLCTHICKFLPAGGAWCRYVSLSRSAIHSSLLGWRRIRTSSLFL